LNLIDKGLHLVFGLAERGSERVDCLRNNEDPAALLIREVLLQNVHSDQSEKRFIRGGFESCGLELAQSTDIVAGWAA
jgi:hypothetical protein